MKVIYKCHCMQDEGSFEMAQRGDGEDIMVFMARLTKALSKDHHHRNPLCTSQKSEYVKIPVSGAGGRVG